MSSVKDVSSLKSNTRVYLSKDNPNLKSKTRVYLSKDNPNIKSTIISSLSKSKNDKKKKPKKKYRQPKVNKPSKASKSNIIKNSESKELKRHLYIFKSLTKKARNRDIILKKAPLTLYKTIRLLFKLVKKGAVPLTNGQRNRLKPWSNFIRDNSIGRDSQVKQNISQNGDGLGSILKTVLPIIAPILSMIG